MGLLHTEFASGAMFTAGSTYGTTGTSGINEFTNRMNILTPDGNLVTGSVISGTSTELYGNFAGIYAGEGIDFNNGSVIVGENTSTTNKGIIELATEDEVQTGTDTARAVVPDTLQSVAPPIGAVIAWLKSFTSVPQTLPTGWVECDGSVISDADSPLNGETLPDLLSGEFLRGAATTGGTGGTETIDIQHLHSVSIQSNASTDSLISCGADGVPVRPITHTHLVTGNTGNALSTTQSILPKYYNVVWIMRIK